MNRIKRKDKIFKKGTAVRRHTNLRKLSKKCNDITTIILTAIKARKEKKFGSAFIVMRIRIQVRSRAPFGYGSRWFNQPNKKKVGIH